MDFKSELRFLSSKLLLKKTILFSKSGCWEQAIRDKLEKYAVFFEESPRQASQCA